MTKGGGGGVGVWPHGAGLPSNYNIFCTTWAIFYSFFSFTHKKYYTITFVNNYFNDWILTFLILYEIMSQWIFGDFSLISTVTNRKWRKLSETLLPCTFLLFKELSQSTTVTKIHLL